MKQVTDAVNGSADPWYVAAVVTEGALNTPGSGQLANFRASDIAIGDTVGDYLRFAQMLLDGGALLADEGAGGATAVAAWVATMTWL